MKNKTQAERVLEKLKEAKGEWVSGQVFLRDMFLSQYHARIFELQKEKERYGYEGIIESSPFNGYYGFKSYRLRTDNEATRPLL